MKYAPLFLALTTSAALAATHGTSWDLRELWGGERESASMSFGDPPWLRGDGELVLGAIDGHVHEGADHADHADHAVHAHDPHAGVAGYDPHAGVAAYDPHAGVAGYDPHAGVAGYDPHAGVAGYDPHAGLAPHAADPHAVDAPARALPADHPHGPSGAGNPVVVTGVERSSAPNGKNVAEVFAQRQALDGELVRVRATIVKLTEGIRGLTYLHLRDGSGSEVARDHDLTATTSEAFELGETVEVEGRLTLDKDVGLGYRYPALLEMTSRVPGS